MFYCYFIYVHIKKTPKIQTACLMLHLWLHHAQEGNGPGAPGAPPCPQLHGAVGAVAPPQDGLEDADVFAWGDVGLGGVWGVLGRTKNEFEKQKTW